MDPGLFIIGAYVITAILLAGLCLGTWLTARQVKRSLNERQIP